MKKISLFAAALAMTTAAPMLNAPSEAAAEWSQAYSFAPGTTEVAFVSTENSGVYVSFKANPFPSAPPDCTSGVFGSQIWWKLGNTGTLANPGSTADQISKMLILLDAAKLSGQKIKVYRPDTGRCTGTGTAGYPVITGISLG